MVSGDAAQMLIDDRNQRVASALITVAPGNQHLGHALSRGLSHGSSAVLRPSPSGKELGMRAYEINHFCPVLRVGLHPNPLPEGKGKDRQNMEQIIHLPS